MFQYKELEDYQKEEYQFLCDAVRYDEVNIPREPSFSFEEQLDRKSLFEKLDAIISDPGISDVRTESHDRITMVMDERIDIDAVMKMNVDEIRKLPERGIQEPEIAYIDASNLNKGSIPLSVYLDSLSIDELIKAIDEGCTSMTHSALPEAVYSRLEDGDEKGQLAYSGSIIGEVSVSKERNGELSISNLMEMDDIEINMDEIENEDRFYEDDRDFEYADLDGWGPDF